MEENSMTMQTLVIAHAGFGHNHFFKNNYFYRQWTDAEGILDYLSFARDYVAQCEEKYGFEAVERVLDAAHALKDQGVNRYAHRSRLNLAEEHRRNDERRAYDEATYNDLWRTVPTPEKEKEDPDLADKQRQEIKRQLGLPEENLLYLIEKRAPRLEDWQRELIRIVRLVSQYFYPQKQLQLMNEGCATYVHYQIMNRLHDRGLITEGSMLEFLHSHSSVVFQPGFDDPRFSGLNPYALGFEMMSDIHRICEKPTPEDREWFSDIAGCGDPFGVLRHAWANYRDESFILQYLSPAVIRKFKLFHVADDASKPALKVEAIHDDWGYRRVRTALSRQYDLSRREPDIQVVDVDLTGDRCLILAHYVHDGVLLEDKTCRSVLRYTASLWGYAVKLLEIEAATDKVLKTYESEAK
jgi:stage V sporulation protein R